MYPVDSYEYEMFHKDEAGNWFDEDTCKVERLGFYAPVDKSAIHISADGKLRNWQGIEVDCWGSVVANTKVILFLLIHLYTSCLLFRCEILRVLPLPCRPVPVAQRVFEQDSKLYYK